VQKTGRPYETVPLTLEAGEVRFHYCLTIHGSVPNFTAKTRRSLVMRLMPGRRALCFRVRE